MKDGNGILGFNLVVLLLLSCSGNVELNDLTELSWYDFDYDARTLTIDPYLDFLNEVFFEVKNDSLILVEIFGKEVPSAFVFYRLNKRISNNKWQFSNKELDKKLELELT